MHKARLCIRIGAESLSRLHKSLASIRLAQFVRALTVAWQIALDLCQKLIGGFMRSLWVPKRYAPYS
jgi:hypothetical protein